MKTESPYIEARMHRMQQQEAYWFAFRRRLEIIENTYGISKSGIAQGLEISRQSLYNFVNKPDRGVRIDRSSIVGLFDYIRFEESDSFKDGQGFVKSRRELTIEDLNLWLHEAGYAPETSGKSISAQSIFQTGDHQIKRVVLRLNSKWIPDDSTKNYLVNNFLDQILDQSRLNESYYAEVLEYLKNSDEKRKEIKRRSRSTEDGGYDVLSFSEAVLYDDSNSEEKIVRRKYEAALKHFSQSGKRKFVRAELFELYQSILEHHYLDRESSIKISTQDCRFSPLTFSLFEQNFYRKGIQGQDRALDAKIRSSIEIAEREVRGLSTDEIRRSSIKVREEDYIYSTANPVLEVVIRCHLTIEGVDSKKVDSEHSNKEASFFLHHSSDATPVNNLVLALKNGLCYPLNITNFFLKPTGRNEKSLMRVSVTLSEPRKEEFLEQDKTIGEYAGWWVTLDMLTGIQKATTHAFSRWLSNRPFPQESYAVEKYLTLCVRIGDIQQMLSQAKRALYEHIPVIKSGQSRTLQKFIDSKIFQEVQNIREDPEFSEIFSHYYSDDYFATHRMKLENAVNIAKVLSLRASLIDDDIHVRGKTNNYEDELEGIINDSENPSEPFSRIIRLYAVACEMNYKFIVGNQEFIIGKQWKIFPRYLSLRAIEDVREYVSTQGGAIDLDTCLAMSDIYGTIGLLGFYCDNSMAQLEESLENLIKATHFALKINYRKRAARLISYASRVCIRQGRLERASRLLSLSAGILDDSILEEIDTRIEDPHFDNSEELEEELTRLSPSVEVKNNASWLIAYGELLLAMGKADEAFVSFFASLRISIPLQISRIIPDCLYNISRSAHVLGSQSENADNSILSETSEGIFKNIGDDSLLSWMPLTENHGVHNSLTRRVLSYLKKMEALKEAKNLQGDLKLTYARVANDSQVLAVDFWNSWKASYDGSHPIAQAIENFTFLAPIH